MYSNPAALSDLTSQSSNAVSSLVVGGEETVGALDLPETILHTPAVLSQLAISPDQEV